MPRASRKSNKPARAPAADNDIEIGDVTAAVFPEGIPQDPDGQVSAGGSIPVAQARALGAVTANAAAANKQVARQIDRANKGESVSWNDDDPLALFDNIRAAWPSLAIRIFIKDVDTGEQYAQPSAQAFRDSTEFYNYLLKTVHRTKRSAKYEVMFKAAGNSSIRGKGFIMMPDTTAPEASTQIPQGPPSPYVWNPATGQWVFQQPPPPQMAIPQGPFGYPSPYGAPPQQGAPPSPQGPPQNIHIHNPPPPPQPSQASAAQMQPPPYPPPAPAPVMAPPGTDPILLQMLQNQAESTNRLQLMLAEVIGANAVRAQQPVAPLAPQVHQPPPPPQGFTYAPIPGWVPPGFEPPPGYTLQPVQQQQYAPQGVGAPPPAPAAAVPPAPPPMSPPIPGSANPLGIDVAGVLRAMKSIDDIKKVFGVTAPAAAEAVDNEPAEFIPPPVPEVTSVPLGQGPDAMVYVHNKDGSPNVMGMILGNMHKVPKFLTDVAQGVGKMNEVVEDAARRAPIQAQHVYPPQNNGPVVEARRLVPVQQQPPPPPAPPVQNTQQRASLIPNVPRA